MVQRSDSGGPLLVGLSMLRAVAEAAARVHGHSLAWVAPWHGERGSHQTGGCERCGRSAFVSTFSVPPMGGDAMLSSCDGGEARRGEA